MGIMRAGDFKADEIIKKLDKAVAYRQNKPVTKYTFAQEEPITTPISEDVWGPDAESISIGYRLPGNKSKDVLLADLVGQILTNGKAGLMVLNRVKNKKLLIYLVHGDHNNDGINPDTERRRARAGGGKLVK